jgi:hypothetical protein
MKVKIEELEGEALDWAVAYIICPDSFRDSFLAHNNTLPAWAVGWLSNGSPSQSWSQCGPLIEKYKIELLCYGKRFALSRWEAQIGGCSHYIDQYPGEAIGGPTPLIAAMRAIVADSFGDEIDIPDELM